MVRQQNEEGTKLGGMGRGYVPSLFRVDEEGGGQCVMGLLDVLSLRWNGC